jgi:hypothetical protein
MRVSEIIDMLSADVGFPVILTNQAAPRPPYPYIGVTETIPFQPGPRSLENVPEPIDIKQVASQQATMTLSVTAYGSNFATTMELSQKAHDWFSFTGYQALKEAGYVVASIGGIDNRDTLVVDDYERRRGFDVTLRFVHQQERIVEEIDSVDPEFVRRSD